jgi:hypothetical protein
MRRGSKGGEPAARQLLMQYSDGVSTKKGGERFSKQHTSSALRAGQELAHK